MTFTVSLKGITEKLPALVKLHAYTADGAAPMRIHSPMFGSKLNASATDLSQMLTAGPSLKAIAQTTRG